MKLGTVLAAAASAVLMTAQPALAAETRSASSLPSATTTTSSVKMVRSASKVGQSDQLVGVPFLVIIAGLGVALVVLDAVGVIHVLGLSDS